MQRCISIQSNVGQETQLLATVQDFKQENLYQVFWPFITLILLIPFFSSEENTKVYIQISLKRSVLYSK